MKLIILCLLFFPATVFADSWYAFEKSDPYGSFSERSKCEQVEGQKCFDISKIKDVRKMKVGFLMPKVQNTFDCAGSSSCQELIDSKGPTWCDSADKSFDDKSNWPGLNFEAFGRSPSGWFAWCKVEGLVVDSAKVAAVDAEDAQKQQVEQMKSEGEKAIVVGKEAKSLMVGYIKTKNLPKAQRKQLRSDLKSIISALDVGSIDVAIDEIKALTEDGTVVTPEAKALILKVFGDAGYNIN